ncbi:hypothetical protein EDB81DRAFT_183295 [Dactylonectria macrodidyma]|uniref:Heterokaryon incompatibility domain-containing protein n=1 Tax=Dactylonectria macrodidyma TaxID=307937 RepID=A0A9P9FQW0_9HYPO|nr:hypothetical protein EDB81DRAFT_183295 [Dactylonectria macrodidyma]
MFATAWDSLQTAIRIPAHKPLKGDGSFRLVQLVPDPTMASQGGFRVALQHFTVQNAPPFHVLSYTRGPSIYQEVAEEWQKDIGCEHFSAADAQSEQAAKDEPSESSGSSWVGSWANHLTSTLSTMSLSDKNLTSIKVNSGHVKVHQSVVDFLQMAWHQQRYIPRDLMRTDPDSKADSKKQEIHLWVDAICINLEDDHEHTHQASQLGAIYKAAEKTVVWLSSNEPPEGVVWTMTEFLPRYSNSEVSGVFDEIWSIAGAGVDTEHSLGDEMSQRWREHELLHFCTFIARHEIFYRHGWIQEILLSPNVELACGRLSFDWATLERFMIASAPAAHQCFNGFIFKTKMLRNTFQRMLSVIDEMKMYGLIRELWVRGTPEARRVDIVQRFGPLRDGQEQIYCQIFSLMRMLRGRHFNDRRDAVYGWMALTKLALPTGKTYGSPSYTMPEEKVYFQFTKSMLRGIPTLDVLSDVGETTWHGVRAGLPSWVPDYSQPPMAIPFYRRVRDNRAADFDATRLRVRVGAVDKFVEFDDRCLVLSGMPLDVIQDRGADFPLDIVSSAETPVEWLLLKCLEMGETYAPTGQPAHEALCFTLVADSFVLDGPLTYAEAFRGLWVYLVRRRMEKLTESGKKKLLRVMHKLRLMAAGASWILAAQDELTDAERLNSQSLYTSTADLFHRVSKTLPGRAPYLSLKGYLGLGPRDIRVGDEIWLLEGGRTPFLLRPGPTGYHLVGETYVHGFMRGEGWTPEQRELQQVRIV